MPDRQIELTWVCPRCSTRNKGRYIRCQQCDAPKPADVAYDMPANTAAEPTVTDAKLRRMATAGPNWQCAYCGSSQRKLDGTCGQCGAPSPAEHEIAGLIAALAAPPVAAETPELLTWWQRWGRQQQLALAAAVVAIVGAVGGYLWTHRTRHYDGVVERVHWKHQITVERYTVWTRNGWRLETPDGAFDVVSKGQQVHDTEHKLVGYDTETYYENTQCGEDCTQTSASQSCHEVCSDNHNGFASCHQECTSFGGGRSCTPRYCNERRTRQTPRYQDIPHYQEAIEYKIWDWDEQRKVVAEGDSADPATMRWPEDEAKIGQGLAEREREREGERTASYEVTMRYDDKLLQFPVSRALVFAFAPGTRHAVSVDDGKYVIDGKLADVR